MERIEFNYVFTDDNGEEKMVTTSKRNEGGIHDYDVCGIFLDFMRSVGYAEENIFKYFQE